MNWSISTNIFSNPLAVTDPDSDPGVRESVWTQWGNPPQNPALFADGTDGLDVKTLNITNRSQVCGARSAARFDHPNLPRVNASAAFHAAVLAQPKKIRDGTEAAQPPEYPAYRSAFLSRKSAAFLQSCGLTQI